MMLPIPPRNPSSKNAPRFVKYLKRSLDFLWDGKGPKSLGHCSFICNALERVHHSYEDPKYKAKLEIQKIICSRLGKADNYEHWLRNTQNIDHTKCSPAEIQEARRQWIQDLIEEFGGR